QILVGRVAQRHRDHVVLAIGLAQLPGRCVALDNGIDLPGIHQRRGDPEGEAQQQRPPRQASLGWLTIVRVHSYHWFANGAGVGTGVVRYTSMMGVSRPTASASATIGLIAGTLL